MSLILLISSILAKFWKERFVCLLLVFQRNVSFSCAFIMIHNEKKKLIRILCDEHCIMNIVNRINFVEPPSCTSNTVPYCHLYLHFTVPKSQIITTHRHTEQATVYNTTVVQFAIF